MSTAPTTAREAGDESVEAGRFPGQLPWYRFATRFVEGKTALDVGCGLAKGLEILQGAAAKAEGIDLDPRLARSDVKICGIEDIPDKSYDVVVSVEVIEHVEKDVEFVQHLGRVAREGVLVTTPNWTLTRCEWPYHVREYTPRQLYRLLSSIGQVSLYKGDSTGSVSEPVRYRQLYDLVNDLRAWPPTAFPTRVVNHLMPRKWRLWGHNAAWVEIDRSKPRP
jgi:SAM-dependent methyltransferase